MAFEIWKYTAAKDATPPVTVYETSIERLVNTIFADVQTATTSLSIQLDKVNAEEVQNGTGA